MNKTERKSLEQELRLLRSDYRRVASGGWLPANSGVPWCNGCDEFACDGCATRLHSRDRAQPIVDAGEALKTRLSEAGKR
jgi:hypothetical protein